MFVLKIMLREVINAIENVCARLAPPAFGQHETITHVSHGARLCISHSECVLFVCGVVSETRPSRPERAK